MLQLNWSERLSKGVGTRRGNREALSQKFALSNSASRNSGTFVFPFTQHVDPVTGDVGMS